jgi:short-subunit dehydrogenase
MMRIPYLAAFEMTRAFLPAMIERGSGRIACMTSLAAFTRIPGSTGYSVARWAMRAFADQLRCDLRGTGVGVTLLVPAEVDSPYFETHPGTKARIPKATALLGGATTPEVIARASANALERDRNQVIAPRRAALVMKVTPKPILDRLTARTGWRRG